MRLRFHFKGARRRAGDVHSKQLARSSCKIGAALFILPARVLERRSCHRPIPLTNVMSHSVSTENGARSETLVSADVAFVAVAFGMCEMLSKYIERRTKHSGLAWY